MGQAAIRAARRRFRPERRWLPRPRLVEAISEGVGKGKPFFGICVGMQMLATWGREYEDTKGFDCSGYVGYCFGQSLEMSMPNRSADYRDFGSEISLLECRPGDVICFSGRNINRTIGHVGIVIDGHSENPLFIHASTSQGVRVDALRSPYFEPRFIGVRRVIQP